MYLQRKLEISDPWDTKEVVFRHRTEFCIPIRQPLLLISQIQRSGGTLLTQLLDSHPQLHVHPSELHVGRPNKYFWPMLDARQTAEEIFDQLVEKTAILHACEGYSKSGILSNSVMPFVFSVELQKVIFKRFMKKNPATHQRQILDAYVTSYFNAWLDYQYLYRRPESVRFWVAFVPRVTFDSRNREAIFGDYPDGRLISIIREPVSWYVSAKEFLPDVYADPATAIGLWRQSVEAALGAWRKWPDQVLLLSFEDLVTAPECELQKVYNFARIDKPARAALPTFNGIPIEGNSSFEKFTGVVLRSPSNRRKYADAGVQKDIMNACAELFEAVRVPINAGACRYLPAEGMLSSFMRKVRSKVKR